MTKKEKEAISNIDLIERLLSFPTKVNNNNNNKNNNISIKNYELFNVASENRDSIYTPNSSSEVEKRGQIYINIDILKQLGDQIKSLQRSQALLRKDLVKAGVIKAE